jgi:predicted small lipoprotein YifL
MRHLVFLTLAVAVLSALVGCGTKGDLYLPTDETTETSQADDGR